MATGELNARGNRVMDSDPIQGEKKYTPLQLLYATETGISTGLMGHLAQISAGFTFTLHLSRRRDGLTAQFPIGSCACRSY